MGHAELVEAIWAAIPPGTEPERLAERRDWLLARVHAGQRVLDVGCGEGAFALGLLAHGAQVQAADVAAEPVRRAQAAGIDACLVALDGLLPFADAAFDVVWAGEVVEHVVDVQGWLSELRRTLPSGGRLLLTTPDLEAALASETLERIFDPRGDHLRFFTEGTLRDVVAAAGFDGVQIVSDGGTLFLAADRARF